MISAGDGYGSVVQRMKPGAWNVSERPRTRFLCAALAALLALGGCAANPVTGEKELVLISAEEEIAMGRKHYRAAQQAGGGVYKADPALGPYVASVGRRVAAVSDRALPYQFVVLNDGTPNAWALPGGKIAINRGLLVELDNEAELAAVLSHEVVHAAARHGARSVQRGLLSSLVLLGVAHASEDSRHADYAVGGAQLALQLTGQKYSREAERVADYHGMKYMRAAGYDTAAAVTLQKKFVALAKGRKSGWLEGLFASHPPSSERVENNRKALAEFPAGGELGRDRYRERLAYLRARRDAYEQAERARESFDANPGAALRDVDAAIAREPREPRFYGIKGHVLSRMRRYREATRAYDAAIERDPGYYEYFLGRGLAYEALGERARARADLERGNRLLPTAVASYNLGEIALKDGDTARAKRYFKTASEADGAIGDDAREAFVRLDIGDAPWRYVDVEIFFADGQVVIEVENSTAYALRDVAVRVEAEINGAPVHRRVPLARLAARAVQRLGSGVYYREEDAVEARTRVLEARLAP